MEAFISQLQEKLGPIRSWPSRALWSIWNRMGFFHFHLLVFFVLSLIAGIIVYLIELGYTRSSFIDCWSMAVSAVCVTGLAVIDMSRMGTASHIVLWCSMLGGGVVIASMAPVLIRWTYFRKHVANAQRHSQIKFPVARALVGLSRQEYRALTKLLIIIPLYVFFFCFIGGICVSIYTWADAYTNELLRSRNQNFWWFAAFHSVAAFNNAGFATLSDNFIPFIRSSGLLFIFAVLIVSGNVGFPIFLRGFIALFYKISSVRHKKVFKFLLDHPRLCFVYLFPTQQTWYLLAVLVGFTCLQWFLEMGLDWNLPHFEQLSVGARVMAAFFQAISTRTAGFAAFDLSLASPAVYIVYLVMMYISSYPVALSARTSTINKSSLRPEDEENAVYHVHFDRAGKNNVKYQAKNLIFRDISYLFIALLIIAIVEDDKLTTDTGFTIFKLLFELVSAYGTVGLSLGYPGSPLSLSGLCSPLSKFIFIVVMLLGRHRGLPLSIDHAVSYTSAIAIDLEAESNRKKSAKMPELKDPQDRKAILQEQMLHQVAMSPGGTRRVTVDIADVDRRKSRMRSDSF